MTTAAAPGPLLLLLACTGLATLAVLAACALLAAGRCGSAPAHLDQWQQDRHGL